MLYRRLVCVFGFLVAALGGAFGFLSCFIDNPIVRAVGYLSGLGLVWAGVELSFQGGGRR